MQSIMIDSIEITGKTVKWRIYGGIVVYTNQVGCHSEKVHEVLYMFVCVCVCDTCVYVCVCVFECVSDTVLWSNAYTVYTYTTVDHREF